MYSKPQKKKIVCIYFYGLFVSWLALFILLVFFLSNQIKFSVYCCLLFTSHFVFLSRFPFFARTCCFIIMRLLHLIQRHCLDAVCKEMVAMTDRFVCVCVCMLYYFFRFLFVFSKVATLQHKLFVQKMHFYSLLHFGHYTCHSFCSLNMVFVGFLYGFACG